MERIKGMNAGKILIVEDEFVVAETLRTELESMGYAVLGLVASGEEAVALARQEKPHLVLMDIKLLGEMDGVETAIYLRRELDVPCLFLTAFADERFLMRAKLAEPLGYLVKPYDRKGLRAGIEMASCKARMERVLKESESRFRAMFETSPVAYMVLDAVDRYLDFNAELCDLLGYDREELIGRCFVECWSSETRRLYLKPFSNVKDKGRFQMELVLVRKDSARLTVLIEGSVQRNLEGEFLRLHCVLHNITQRHRIEAERLRLTQQEQQIRKAESLNCMAGAIAHHFNNMLSVVIGNLELALEDLPTETACIDNISTAMQFALRASEMSSFMLTYLGHLKTNARALDLRKICNRIVPKLWETIPGQIQLLSEFPSPGPVVNADAGQIGQVLTRLVDNAREAIGDGNGQIRVSIRTLQRVDIPEISIWPPDWKPTAEAYAALQVADTGCGICAMDIEKVMDPFFSTKFTGRGLGLAMVLGIVRAHNGAVTVQSEIGVGSVIQVLLPLSDQEPVPDRIENTADADLFEASGRILLVEDEEAVRKMARSLLEQIGFEVLVAKDGVEAIEIFRENQDDIELVISDLTMPRMNGWETLAALWNLNPYVPVILASGYEEGQVMAGQTPNPPPVFLHKPYRLQELKKALAEALSTAF